MTATPTREITPDRSPTREIRKEVRAILADGGLVAIPTETVYGLAGRADTGEALTRLRELKGRDAEHPFTWHVAHKEVLDHFDGFASMSERIADRYWPGPLTLVLEGNPPGLERVTHDGWTGVRLPAHTAARAVLEECDFPVVMTSANRTGEPPISRASALAEAFGDGLDLVLDDGGNRLAESSSVLKLGRGHFQLLREGLVDLAGLKAVAGLSIVFVCTGNTCRSPMAEGLAKARLADRLGVAADGAAHEDFGFTVQSAGVFAGPGSRASENAVRALSERGIDISAHRSAPAVPEMIQAADRVYCLTQGHRESMLLALPPKKGRHVELLDPDGQDVPDPIGGSLDDYKACAAQIERSIERRLEEWV